MSYKDGEDLVIARVRACTGFGRHNVSQADWKVLNSGKSDHYAIVRPGGFEIEWSTLRQYTAHYNTVIEVWQRYIDDTQTATNLYALVNNILALLSYWKLGDTGTSIQDSTITGAETVEEMWNESGGPSWLRWSINVQWDELTTVTFAE